MIEIVLLAVAMVSMLLLAVALELDGLWLYVVMSVVFLAGGIWLDRVFRRLKKRQASQ